MCLAESQPGHLGPWSTACVNKPVIYRRSQLYRLKKGNGYPVSSVCLKLKQLGIFHARSRPKNSKINDIKTIITSKRKLKPESPKAIKPSPLEVPRIWFDLPTLLLSNVTSLTNKLEELSVTARSHNSEVIAITEAWQITPEICTLNDFLFFHHLRTTKRGGGVALFCHKDLKPYQLTCDIEHGLEVLWVRISPPNHPRHIASIIYCVVYHPPRAATKGDLLDHIIHTSDMFRTKYPSSKLVICGDFNEIDTTSLQQQLHLSQVVDFPTHEQNTLDLILTDMAEVYLPPKPLPPVGRSPHLSIVWSPSPTTTQPRLSNVKTYRPLTDSAEREFGWWLSHYDWAQVINEENVDIKCVNYHDTINQAFQHFFPQKTITIHPADAPWITHRIKRLMQQRNRAFYSHDADHYKQLRNKVQREIRAAKKAHYPSKVQHLKQTNISQWYVKVKELTGSEKRKSSSSFPCVDQLSNEEAAQQINIHFANICQRLPQLDITSLPAYLPTPLPPDTVEEYQVAKRLQNLKTKRSTTPIDLPVKIYKKFSYELAKPLTSIINASLIQSKCPTAWKTAYITPLPKTSNPESFNNLRPIAITPIPSLICESFVFDWAYTDIAQSVDPQQFGNMKSSSTTHCLVSLLDFIYRNLEKRKTSVALTFVDFTKAFDLVNHNIIIKKAIEIGLRGCLVSWLSDFLTGRHQSVRFKGITSNPLPTTCGVPQGTKMGPLCFLILINDALSDTNHRWKYVDDSTIGVTIDNNDPDFSALQDNINNLQEWTTANDVTINHSKTVMMHINLGADNIPPPVITLGPDAITIVNDYKLLGVTIDDGLNWKCHVSNVIKSSSYRLYLLRRLRSLGVPSTELKNVYNIFILPKLTYASPAWSSSLSATQRQQLERVQKRACRIIQGPSHTTYQEALLALNLTPIANKHQELTYQFGRKLLSHPRHRELLPPDAPQPRIAVRHHNRLLPIRARTDRYKNSPIPTIVNAINNK